ncbi:MAG TPA: polysaccharide biosynthesis tyrosine autokinase [Armatimonadota bacterium]
MPDRREQELDLHDYLTIVARRGWLIALTLVAVVAATVFYSLTTTKLYEAESRVLLRSPYVPFGGGGGGGNTGTGLGMGNLSDTYDLETELERIKNPQLIKEVRAALPTFQDAMLSNLDVHQVGKTSIVAIDVRSPSSQFAAQFAQGLAVGYIDHTRRMKQGATEQALKYVVDQAGRAKADLDRAETELRTFKEASGIVDIAGATGSVASHYAVLSTQLDAGQVELRKTEAQLAGLEGERRAVDPRQIAGLTLTPESSLGQMRAQLQQLMLQRMMLLKDYAPTSRRITALDQQIQGLQDSLQQQVSQIAYAELEQSSPQLQDLKKRKVALETQRIVTLANNGALATMLGRARGDLRLLPGQQVKFGQLERKVKVAETAYTDLLAQEQALSIQQAAAVASASVLNQPDVPTEPVSPQLKKNLVAGVLLGLLLGLVAGLVVERLDDTFHSPKELERILRLPVLGLVRLKTEGDTVMLQDDDERSPFAEAFRSLRANLRLTSVDGQPATVLITSSGRGEGKSTCAANLAIESARAGQQVILVDADLRRPALHRYFNLDGKRGLTSVLVGDMPLAEGLQSTSVPGLRLLAAGGLPPNPLVLIESQAMKELMASLNQEADLVIFDSPPVLVAADSQVLGSLMEATVLVVETAATRREMATRTMELLRRASAKVIGVAINKSSRRESGYNYYYYQYYRDDDKQSVGGQ